MPALNFPDSPAENATYTNSETGVVYVYKNGAWRTASNETNLDDVYVQVSGDNMTGPLTIGPEGGTALTTLDDDGSAIFGNNVTINRNFNDETALEIIRNGDQMMDLRSNGKATFRDVVSVKHTNSSGLAVGLELFRNGNPNPNCELTVGGLGRFSSGITFGPLADAADNNTLKDYEKGTFTITTEGGYVLQTETANYTQIGNIVILTGVVNFSQVGANTSVVVLRGIPFSALSSHTPGMARESSTYGYVYVCQVNTGSNMMSINTYDGVDNGTRVFEANKNYVFSVSFLI